MLRTRIFIALVFITILCFPGRALAQVGDGPEIIQWPSEVYPTIQEAVDALQDGGKLEIAEGEYVINESIFVIGKRIVIKGAGSGLEDENGPITYLIGPTPKPVLDEERNVILSAKAVVGLINLIGADVVIQDMRISGFDAGLVVRDDDEGNPAFGMVSNVLITKTGRGILSFSSGKFTFSDSEIRDTLWHGVISIAPPVGPLQQNILLENSLIQDIGGVGVYFIGGKGVVQGTEENPFYISFGIEAGIACVGCDLEVRNAHLFINAKFGIFVIEGDAVIEASFIDFTCQDVSPPYGFGDGIFVALSTLLATSNLIQDSARASLSNFGSNVCFGWNTFQCADYELNAEDYYGQNWNFTHLGGNVCGCPTATDECQVLTSTIEPPEALPPVPDP